MYVYIYINIHKRNKKEEEEEPEKKEQKTNERLVIGAKNLSNLFFELIDHIFFRWNIRWS